MILGHAGNEDHGAGVDPRAAPANAPGGGGCDHGERGDEIGREVLIVEARHMQFAGRHHRGRATMHVVADPADGVLGWRPFAEHRMDMAVDEAGHDGALAGIEHGVGFGVGGRIESCDLVAVDQERRDRGLRPGDVAGEELADVLDEQRGHQPHPVIPGRAEGADPESTRTCSL